MLYVNLIELYLCFQNNSQNIWNTSPINNKLNLMLIHHQAVSSMSLIGHCAWSVRPWLLLSRGKYHGGYVFEQWDIYFQIRLQAGSTSSHQGRFKTHLLSLQHTKDTDYSKESTDEDGRVRDTTLLVCDHSQQFAEQTQEKQSHT